jgi:hypothetical protein
VYERGGAAPGGTGAGIYDGCHDPVLTAEPLALIEGRAQPQHRSTSHAPDRDVSRSCRPGGPP